MLKKFLFPFAAAGLVLSSLPVQAMPGMYDVYTPQAFAEAAPHPRVLFFHAAWCPSCRAADAKLKDLALPEGVMIFNVDYDKAADLKARYGITMQNTFVLVDANGEKVAQWVGLDRALADQFLGAGQELMMAGDDAMMMKK